MPADFSLAGAKVRRIFELHATFGKKILTMMKKQVVWGIMPKN
jgi:hypothetical protein